ncbi:MAG: 3-deoxy-7-phosphoheptulonate synthase [Chloroflexi bacterium RBG_13_51_36]|nr:MAG: 3-deoxy-7-phosphoheptulonate synthase [Chloroflexi bacterium RBG_13_51_36]
MIIVMKTGSGRNEIGRVTKRIEDFGLKTHISEGVDHTVIGVLGKVFTELRDALELLPGVEQVLLVSKPYKLASREFHPRDTIVEAKGVPIGGNEVVVMAGPCAIESEEQLLATAQAVKAAGATVLRGGAFKPRTSPYDFRGLGEAGLKILAAVGKENKMPVITEVMSPDQVDLVAKYADILQIGARNMQNFILLDEVGKTKKPVLLKRGLSSTIQEWLLAAEYILAQDNEQVILCERGIRTFETYTRNTLDISAIPIIEKVSHLPIIIDPSHATGKWYLVSPIALAAVAAGADGLLIEVHPNPDLALADGPQSLNFDSFRSLMSQLLPIAKARNRKLIIPSAKTNP